MNALAETLTPASFENVDIARHTVSTTSHETTAVQNITAKDRQRTTAICAFTLNDTSGGTEAQRLMLEQIWKSQADVIVLIERGTPNGFRALADARSLLLRMGRRAGEGECHVLAPVRSFATTTTVPLY